MLDEAFEVQTKLKNSLQMTIFLLRSYAATQFSVGKILLGKNKHFLKLILTFEMIDFKDNLLKELLDYTKKLHRTLVDVRKDGDEKFLSNLIKEHVSGDFRSSRVKLYFEMIFVFLSSWRSLRI